MIIQKTSNSPKQIGNSNFSSIQPEDPNLSEADLEKFYEERQSLMIDMISQRDKPPTPSKQNKRYTPRNKTNFSEMTNHKNISPSNIITYEAFKESNQSFQSKYSNEPVRSQSMRSLKPDQPDETVDRNRPPMKNSKEMEDIVNMAVNESSTNKNTVQSNKNNDLAKYEFNSFRKNSKPQVKETQQVFNSNNNAKGSKSQVAIALTDQNLKHSSILKTESKPPTHTLNLFNRSINLKSEIAQRGLQPTSNPSSLPKRPLTPLLSNRQHLTSTNSSLNIPNTNLDNQSAINKSFISNPTYANEMLSIISKRKAMLNASQSQPKSKEEQFNDFYTRNLDYYSKAKEKADTKRSQLTKEEQDKCPFNPKLSESTMKLINDSRSNIPSAKTDDFYKKNIKWKNSRDKEVQQQSVLHDKERFEECYFHPTINKEMHEMILKEMKGQKPDYIYKKNIKWLEKVNENRKQNQLEQIEQMRLEQEKMKLQNQKLLDLGNQLRSKQSSEETLRQLATPKRPVEKHFQYRSQSAKKKNDSRPDSLSKGKEEYTIGKDIHEIKDLISSLQETLNENRQMNINYNRDMILIGQRCNVNIVK